MGPAAFRRLSKGRVPLRAPGPVSPAPGAWLVSGYMTAFPKSSAAQMARAAIQLASSRRELVFRNPEKIELGWKRMRKDRAAFIEFFGADELVLSPADAPSFDFPAGLADLDTVGVIFDEIDGLNFYDEYGMLRELFADPALAADKRYSGLLRGYLESDTIGPPPIRRMAVAHPETVDAVFRKVLRKSSFVWAKHDEALLQRRKPWYFEHEPLPGVSVIGARLSELAGIR